MVQVLEKKEIYIIIPKAEEMEEKAEEKIIQSKKKVKREFCALTGRVASDKCPNTEALEVPIDIAFEECEFHKLKIDPDNLYIYWVIETKYKSVKLVEENGIEKEVVEYDYARAMQEDNLIGSNFRGYDAFRKLTNLFNRTKKSVQKSTVRVVNPKPNDIRDMYGSYKAFFPSRQTADRLFSEIRGRIERGQKLDNKISRSLQMNYRQPKYIIEDLWDWMLQDYNKLPPEEKALLKEFSELKGDDPKKSRKLKERERPFPFDLTRIENAKRKGYLDPREARILKYRYGLDGQGTRSLQQIGGWLGISHATVRKIEHQALLKMQEYIENHRRNKGTGAIK